LNLVEERGCCGVGSGSAHENTVNVVGPLVDRGRDAGEAGEELDRVWLRGQRSNVRAFQDGERLVVPGDRRRKTPRCGAYVLSMPREPPF